MRSEIALPAPRLRAVLQGLLQRYGPQGWWPGDSPLEIMVGAVLTQSTAWCNVERAIDGLKREGLLGVAAIADAPVSVLARVIRPAGYFNVKAARLQILCRFLARRGGPEGLRAVATPSLRRALLAIHGIGPETADDILLYGLERPVFVIDAYTRRLFARLGLISGREPYEELRLAFERALGPDAGLFNEFHALIVRHAKETCRKAPDCTVCCLRSGCAAGAGAGH